MSEHADRRVQPVRVRPRGVQNRYVGVVYDFSDKSRRSAPAPTGSPSAGTVVELDRVHKAVKRRCRNRSHCWTASASASRTACWRSQDGIKSPDRPSRGGAAGHEDALEESSAGDPPTGG